MPEPTPREARPPVPGASSRELFDGQIAALNAHDVDVLMAHFSDDVVFVNMHDAAHPRNGRGELRAQTLGLYARFPDLHAEVRSVVADEHGVVGELVVSGTCEGKPVRLHYCLVDQVADGLIVREHAYWDANELAEQIGQRLPPISID